MGSQATVFSACVFSTLACGAVAATVASYYCPLEVRGRDYALTVDAGWMVIGRKGELPSLIMIPCWGVVAAILVLLGFGVALHRAMRLRGNRRVGFPVTQPEQPYE